MREMTHQELSTVSGGDLELSNLAFGLFVGMNLVGFGIGAAATYQSNQDYVTGSQSQIKGLQSTITDMTSRIDRIVGSHDFHQPITAPVTVSSR